MRADDYPNINRDGSPVEREPDGSPAGPSRDHPHPDNPLGHAEVKAVNELLWRRGENLDESVFGDLRADTFFPYGKPEIPQRPYCANCAMMLHGTQSNPGRFTGYPPDDTNFLPG